jgi:hypothetical protein
MIDGILGEMKSSTARWSSLYAEHSREIDSIIYSALASSVAWRLENVLSGTIQAVDKPGVADRDVFNALAVYCPQASTRFKLSDSSQGRFSFGAGGELYLSSPISVDTKLKEKKESSSQLSQLLYLQGIRGLGAAENAAALVLCKELSSVSASVSASLVTSGRNNLSVQGAAVNNSLQGPGKGPDVHANTSSSSKESNIGFPLNHP